MSAAIWLGHWAAVNVVIAAAVFAWCSVQMTSERMAERTEAARLARWRVAADRLASILPSSLDRLSDRQVASIYHNVRYGFPDENRNDFSAHDGMPYWIPVGTAANPLHLVRVTDSSLNDYARYSTVDAFYTGTVDE